MLISFLLLCIYWKTFWAYPVAQRLKKICLQCRRCDRSRRLYPWVRKIPWGRKWQPHFSILAWEIPWTEEPRGLQSVGSQRVWHDLATQFSSVQSLFVTPWTSACQASLSIINSRSLHKPLCIESVKPSNHLVFCRPLLLLPSIFSSIMVFSNQSVFHIRWTKCWSFRFDINPSNEHSGLIFRKDWLDLPAVQGILKSLLQHHSSKASILQWSAFFIVQFSHPYMTTGRNIALTRRTFVDNIMSLLFNMLSRLVITFLPSSKWLLISWLQSPTAVILEPQKIKSVTVATVPHLFAMKCQDRMPWS